MDNLAKKLEVLFALEKYEDVLKFASENLYKSEMDKLLLYNYIIISHINLGNYDKALELCNNAIGVYPDEAFLFQLRAKIYLHHKKIKPAYTITVLKNDYTAISNKQEQSLLSNTERNA